MLERFTGTFPRPRLNFLAGLAFLLIVPTASASPMASSGEATTTDESTTECVLNVSPPPLELRWDEIPTEATIAYLENHALSLRIRNESDLPLATELFLKVRAGGREIQRPVDTLQLAPREESVRVVDVALPEIDLSTLRISGQLQLYSQSHDGEGALVEHSSAPTVFFHPDSSSEGLWAYGLDALAKTFGNGDFRGEVEVESLHQQLIALVPEFATANFAAPVEAGDGRETPTH